jgi:hypothetical protein
LGIIFASKVPAVVPKIQPNKKKFLRIEQNTPPIAKITSIKNAGAKVFCGIIFFFNLKRLC